MQHQLPPLPYLLDALEPHISRETMEYHYGKHHRTYVEKLNTLIKGTPHENMVLEEIIRTAQGPVFNNAAQTWNHTFFWNCLRPGGGGKPSGDVAQRIDRDLGGYDKFRERFAQAAVDCFGSGWAWLADRGGKLEILATSNADNPLTKGATALLTIDVWEHAYYVDYENRRPEFVNAVIDKLLNWDFAQQQLDGAGGRKAA